MMIDQEAMGAIQNLMATATLNPIPSPSVAPLPTAFPEPAYELQAAEETGKRTLW